MSESVEQAALRRAIELDELPAPWPDVLDSLQAIVGVNDSLFGLVKLVQERHDLEIESLHAENAELRDGLLALSNRIEAVSRTLASRTDHLA